MNTTELTSAIRPLDTPFLFSTHDIRTAVGGDGMVWFCAKDVCDAVEIVWQGAGKTLRNLPETWKGSAKLPTPGGDQEAIYLSEPGVYRLIFRSNKAEAVAFTDWVCAEVLPAIRKLGFFGQVGITNQIKLTNQMLKIVAALGETNDAFVFATLVKRLRNICNQLGEPMVDIAMLGQDRRQLRLHGIAA